MYLQHNLKQCRVLKILMSFQMRNSLVFKTHPTAQTRNLSPGTGYLNCTSNDLRIMTRRNGIHIPNTGCTSF